MGKLILTNLFSFRFTLEKSGWSSMKKRMSEGGVPLVIKSIGVDMVPMIG
ncbi:hypothetical protein [Neomesorhizobium albiziae]|nr:hypothetical protein [Mesorhizobium albiziae]